VITTAGRLPAKFVIHTVGPVWNGGNKNEKEWLANCYRNSLQLAIENDCTTIAFPNISTGIYRFPKAEAATIATGTVKQFLKSGAAIKKVIFVCFDEESYSLLDEQVKKQATTSSS
jgi:O-acetyl-ADP-ribose deacetylase (regulator of RNase III)